MKAAAADCESANLRRHLVDRVLHVAQWLLQYHLKLITSYANKRAAIIFFTSFCPARDLCLPVSAKGRSELQLCISKGKWPHSLFLDFFSNLHKISFQNNKNMNFACL